MTETRYPQALAALDAPPPLIYARGRLPLLNRPTVAVVGSRQCSAAGAKLARHFAVELGRAGYVVASGLARGIDSVAHAAALEHGTVAVLAGGIDVVYPPEHKALQAAIGERGCLLTEMPVGFVPRGKDFPPPQPHHLGGVARGADRGGGTPVGHARNGAACRRAGPGGVRGARPSTRPARRRDQQALEIGGHVGW